MPITFVIYFVIAQTLPNGVKCNEFAIDLIQNYWPVRAAVKIKDVHAIKNHLVFGSIKNDGAMTLNFLKRLLWKQRPIGISMYTGLLTRETALSYFDSIFDYTTNLLIMFGSEIDRLTELK